MEGSKLGGQWKVKEKHFFTSSHFPPNNFTENFNFLFFIFSFDLKVLLYHGCRLLLTHLLPFLRSINYNCAYRCNKSSTPSLLIWFWLKLWFLSSPWSYGVAHGHILWASSRISKWKTASEVISRFDFNIASSWWKTWNLKSARLSWSRSPSGLVLSYFFELSHLGDFVTSQPCFRWWTWNRLWRLLWNWRYFYLRMISSSRRWTLSLVAWSDSSTTSL